MEGEIGLTARSEVKATGWDAGGRTVWPERLSRPRLLSAEARELAKYADSQLRGQALQEAAVQCLNDPSRHNERAHTILSVDELRYRADPRDLLVAEESSNLRMISLPRYSSAARSLARAARE